MTHERILLVDLQYFSPSIFYSSLGSFTHCLFEQYETYQKMSFRNRCVIYGANGPINLTVPLEGGRNQKLLVKDVKVLNSVAWQRDHWRSITSAYNKSPWFEHYRDDLAKLYETPFEFLVDWNLECFNWICDRLSIKIRTELTGSHKHSYEQGVKDWRNYITPKTLQEVFPEGIKYVQVFADRQGFIPNLSVIDYLFCEGPILPVLDPDDLLRNNR